MRMKASRFVAVCLFSLLLLGVVIGVCKAYDDRITADGVTPVLQRLWTTNAQGTGEINVFSIGDEVWLKTADDAPGLALNPGTYRIYVFAGNIFVASPSGPNEAVNGKNIDLIPTVAPTVDVNVGTDGKLALTKIWASVTMPGEFSVVLDQLTELVNGDQVGTNSLGKWDADDDYRDDKCMATPTPPSFIVPPGNVVPEVGTIVIAAAMFGSLGLFIVVKRKKGQSVAE
jgi:hypothetical protein